MDGVESASRGSFDVLTGIQAVMEERDGSALKLVLCGSYIGAMERLLTGVT